MTDKEIIKALEICHHKECSKDCPYLMVSKCVDELEKDALDLINRQQAEIEQWKEEANKYQKFWCEDVQSARTEAIKEVADRLKEKFLTAFDSYAYVTYGDIVMSIENIVKEMVGAIE